MKKLIAAIIMAVTVSAMAQMPVLDSELFRVDIDATVPYGTRLLDEKGSPYIHIDMKQVHVTRFIQIKKQKYSIDAWILDAAVNKKTGRASINGAGLNQFALFAYNTLEGRADKGMVAFSMNIPEQGEGVPAPKLYFAGETDVRWDEEKNRYVLISGKGTCSGYSHPETSEASSTIEKSTIYTLCKMFPAWGTFTISKVDYTEAQIIQIILDQKK